MRLQWCARRLGRDRLGRPPSGGTRWPPRWRTCWTPRARAFLGEVVDARRWDIHDAGFEDAGALWAHLDSTAGALLWAAARALAAEAGEAAIRRAGTAQGLCELAPRRARAGRPPASARCRDPRPEAVAALAREGLARLASARREGVPSAARPAMLATWDAGSILRRAARAPARVAAGTLARPRGRPSRRPPAARAQRSVVAAPSASARRSSLADRAGRCASASSGGGVKLAQERGQGDGAGLLPQVAGPPGPPPQRASGKLRSPRGSRGDPSPARAPPCRRASRQRRARGACAPIRAPSYSRRGSAGRPSRRHTTGRAHRRRARMSLQARPITSYPRRCWTPGCCSGSKA